MAKGDIEFNIKMSIAEAIYTRSALVEGNRRYIQKHHENPEFSPYLGAIAYLFDAYNVINDAIDDGYTQHTPPLRYPGPAPT
jgi:hypothetical protein